MFDQSLKDRIFFLGTMHIQQESVDAVLKAIDQCHPDVIMVELDVLRYKELIQQVTPKKKTQNMLNTTWSQVPDSTIFFQPNSSQLLPTSEINPVHQLNQDFFELLHQFQQSLGDIMGILPGKEMLVAVNAALTRKIPALFIDRPIMETMQRIQSVGNQIQTEQKHIMKSMKENPLSANELQEFIGKFRDPSNVREVISEFQREYPQLFSVLVTERNAYMADKIAKYAKKYPQHRILIVSGGGHIEELVKFTEDRLK